MVISKSEYMMFLKHPAWIWLKKYDKSKLPEPDEDLQALFDQGALFEEYAEKTFPEALKLGYKNGNVFSGTKYYALPQQTAEAIGQGVRTILQGRLEAPVAEHGGGAITSVFDVLERVGERSFNLYEIKSSTSVKPEHILDLAFQTTVLEKSGLSVEKAFVVYVNRDYVRDGEIVPEEISKKEDVTEDVRAALPQTLENLTKAFATLESKTCPDISPRFLKDCSLDEWLPIYKAVRGELPEYSIYNLCALKSNLVELLEDGGVELIGDIPLDLGLNERQERQVVATKTGERKIEGGEIRDFLGGLEFPLHFFDYETVASALPPFDGSRPYQQVPFQYSLHLWSTPESELVHKEYLHRENSNPVKSLIEKMQEDFEGRGSIVSWNKRFEEGRNKEMAEMYPEHKNFLLNLNDRMVDLMIPFSKGWFVDKEFFGSASLKAVLPVLAPELSYKALNVQHGGQAQRVWMQTVLEGKNPKDKEQIFKDLIEYCTLDTYSMYVLLRYLSQTVGETTLAGRLS